MPEFNDDAFRAGIFQFLSGRTNGGADEIHWQALTNECVIAGEQIKLIGASGIWKPAQMDLPISITTAPPKPNHPRPYEDDWTDDGLLIYRYRGTDPSHRDNVGMRQAMEQQKGLVYFAGISRGWYQATWPAYIVEDRPEQLAVRVMVMDPGAFRSDLDPSSVAIAERRYHERLTKQRLHQAGFRERVLKAYKEQCSFCRLRHRELLDAAHIRPDSKGGQPHTSNGLSLCKIHHGAFDSRIVGVRPDYQLEVRSDVLDEIDGPMLRHGIQALHGETLWTPSPANDRPDKEALEERYVDFLAQ